jgi:hypothetical protein
MKTPSAVHEKAPRRHFCWPIAMASLSETVAGLPYQSARARQASRATHLESPTVRKGRPLAVQ